MNVMFIYFYFNNLIKQCLCIFDRTQLNATQLQTLVKLNEISEKS